MKALRRLDLPYLAAAAVLLALVLYLGTFFLKSAESSCLFTLDEERTLSESETVSGVILRCEEPLFGTGSALLAEEGKRIGCGGLVAADARRNLPEEILAVSKTELELLRLRCVYSRQNICALCAVPVLPVPRALDALPTLPAERVGVFDIEKMSKKLENARCGLFESRFVTAPCAGIFSAFTDGYESPDAAVTEAKTYSRAVIGKIVSSTDWFFEADIENRGITVGEHVRLELDGLSVQAELAEFEDGHARFKCSDGIESVLRLRFAEARLVYSELSGFEIPKSALWYDGENEPYVLAAHSAGDEKIYVRLVYDDGENCLVRATNDGDLRPGVKIRCTLVKGSQRSARGFYCE